MFEWARRFIFVCIISVAMSFAMVGFSVAAEMPSKHNQVQNMSEMPCHEKIKGHKEVKSHKAVGDMAAHDDGQNTNNCCDHDCKCAFSHCSNVVALIIPNFAISAPIISEFKNPQNPHFEVKSIQSLLERPPKYYS